MTTQKQALIAYEQQRAVRLSIASKLAEALRTLIKESAEQADTSEIFLDDFGDALNAARAALAEWDAQ